jgi:hypothetical protein
MRALRTLALAFACVSRAYASSVEQVSVEKFRELASLPIGTMRYSEYLGVSDGKACVAVHQMSSLSSKKWSGTVYCADEKALDPDFLKTLE